MQRIVPISLGIDLMGASAKPEDLIKAVLKTAQRLNQARVRPVHFVLFGDPSLVEHIPSGNEALSLYPTTEVVEMSDHPLGVVRRKRDSSMVRGIRAIKTREISAFISMGNTGGLVAASCTLLARLSPHIERPVLLALMPTASGPLAVLDVGGIVVCDAEHLVQYALLGSALQRSYLGKHKPVVGLLNIGEESIKGREEHRQAYRELKEMAETSAAFAFRGNIEGHEVFNGSVDVLVTDGFTGNVFLKTSEGISRHVVQMLEESLRQSNQALQFKNELLNTLQSQIDHSHYPGALLAGVDGIVIKCHGGAPSSAIRGAIEGAVQMIDQDLISQMKSQLGG